MLVVVMTFVLILDASSGEKKPAQPSAANQCAGDLGELADASLHADIAQIVFLLEPLKRDTAYQSFGDLKGQIHFHPLMAALIERQRSVDGWIKLFTAIDSAALSGFKENSICRVDLSADAIFLKYRSLPAQASVDIGNMIRLARKASPQNLYGISARAVLVDLQRKLESFLKKHADDFQSTDINMAPDEFSRLTNLNIVLKRVIAILPEIQVNLLPDREPRSPQFPASWKGFETSADFESLLRELKLRLDTFGTNDEKDGSLLRENYHPGVFVQRLIDLKDKAQPVDHLKRLYGYIHMLRMIEIASDMKQSKSNRDYAKSWVESMISAVDVKASIAALSKNEIEKTAWDDAKRKMAKIDEIFKRRQNELQDEEKTERYRSEILSLAQ